MFDMRVRTPATNVSTRGNAHDEEPAMSGVLHGRLACVSAVDDDFDDEPTSTRLLPRHDEPSPDVELDDEDEPEREVIVWTRERQPRLQH